VSMSNSSPAANDAKVRALAFYLPQFHPVPENDEWWGKGFTEWTNVAKARALFKGHYQPQLPSDLGFYDLRLPEVQEEQAALARQYGLHGFCYYHYWFSGRRILERPVNSMVALGKPDFPFCLCWANENWTRRWDGHDNEVLLKQVYSPADDIKHIRSLIPVFKDSRYIKVDGKPFFLVYRIGHLPEPAETIRRWREEAAKAGLPGLYLANVESFVDDRGAAGRLPLDAAVEFAPDWACLPPRVMPAGFLPRILRRRLIKSVWWKNRVHDYNGLRDRMLAKPGPSYLRYPGVTPSWDNSPRKREDAIILQNASPQGYEQWLKAVVKRFNPPSREENFVFINAWNEWAEGNHLEPCRKWGRGYLEATQRALSGDSPAIAKPSGALEMAYPGSRPEVRFG
jgi:lipopolysaccharide biosynthesis protein